MCLASYVVQDATAHSRAAPRFRAPDLVETSAVLLSLLCIRLVYDDHLSTCLADVMGLHQYVGVPDAHGGDATSSLQIICSYIASSMANNFRK
jgi:hypothetical protein